MELTAQHSPLKPNSIFAPVSTLPKHYTLLDSGNGQKLEQFGPYVLVRPDARAFERPLLSVAEWNNKADAVFIPKAGKQQGMNRGGRWDMKKPLPKQWTIHQPVQNKTLQFNISLSPFGHVGIFPEQAENWNFIAQNLTRIKQTAPKVLNLFAYTGAASVVARAFGAEVYHVDSSRPVLNQARQNMALNCLSDIRWVYEDAFKFAKREAKRGRKYSGIIFDPPPMGRGPSGERWTLDDQLDDLLGSCADILEERQSFAMMSLYAIDWPHQTGKQRMGFFFKGGLVTSGDCFLPTQPGVKTLAQGTFARFERR